MLSEDKFMKSLSRTAKMNIDIKETEIVPIKYMKREFKYKGKYYCDMKELTDDLGLKYDKLIYFLKRKYGTVKIYNYPNIEEILDNIIINNKNRLIIEKEEL